LSECEGDEEGKEEERGTRRSIASLTHVRGTVEEERGGVGEGEWANRRSRGVCGIKEVRADSSRSYETDYSIFTHS